MHGYTTVLVIMHEYITVLVIMSDTCVTQADHRTAQANPSPHRPSCPLGPLVVHALPCGAGMHGPLAPWPTLAGGGLADWLLPAAQQAQAVKLYRLQSACGGAAAALPASRLWRDPSA